MNTKNTENRGIMKQGQNVGDIKIYSKISSNRSSGMMRKNYAGFTLVELIVVMTILMILGAIGFTQLGGFQGSARDSSRLSDINNLSKGFDISMIKSGSYPAPDNAFAVTYSGGLLWNQGTAGNSVVNSIGSVGTKVSKKMVDPLTTKEYTYSKLATGKAYQIKTDWEGDKLAFSQLDWLSSGFISQANAATDNPTIAYVKGNYNGIAIQTETGGIVYLIAVPSIITSVTGAVDQMFDVVSSLSNTLLVQGQTNSGGITYTAQLVYYSGSLPSSDADRATFAANIALAYSGTVITNEPAIQSFITALQTNDTKALVTLGGGFIVNVLGGNTTMQATIAAINIDGSATSYIPDSANGSERFTSTNSGTVVLDNLTGLNWQSYSNTGSADYTANYTVLSNWTQATTYCTNLTLGGITGWRLPDVTEIQSIMDYSKAVSPVIDTTYFGSQGSTYWTSTTTAFGTMAWSVGFSNGTIGYTAAKSNTYYVRCVR